MPYIIVGDEVFPLKKNILRPYPGKKLTWVNVHIRLSRARWVTENSFGILAARWRIFRRPIIAHPDNVVVFTKAAKALHNYFRTTESTVYCPTGFMDAEDGSVNVIPGSWRSEIDGSGGLGPLCQAGENHLMKSTKVQTLGADHAIEYLAWDTR